MNQRKFWGNSDILPFLESFQLLWYFTWNLSFECKIWRNPNINLVLKNLKEFWWPFDLTLVLVQEVQWSARLILVVTVSQASMSASLSPPSYFQWSSSYSCEQIFIYSTTTVTTAAAIIIMHYQIDIMLSQVHHNYNRRYIIMLMRLWRTATFRVSKWVAEYLHIIEYYWTLLNIIEYSPILGSEWDKNIYMNCKTYFSL